MNLNTVVVLLIYGLAARANSIAIKDTSSAADEPNTETNENTRNLTYTPIYKNTQKVTENDLYDRLLERDYVSALKQTLLLYGQGHKQAITNVINRMIDNGLPEIFDYAFKVAASTADFVIKDCFPPEMRFYEDNVFSKIISHKYNMALKIEEGTDSYGDRTIYGTSDKESRFEITWKFIPEWYEDRLYFKIRSVEYPAFMKLGNSRDWSGDHMVYGSKGQSSYRHLWYLKPVRHDGKILFYIINREFDRFLKLGKDLDGVGERQAYGNSQLNYWPDMYTWEIRNI